MMYSWQGTEYKSDRERPVTADGVIGNEATSGLIETADEDEDDVVIASLVAPQTGNVASRQQQQIGWLCGEPMPDYAHVVFRSTR